MQREEHEYGNITLVLDPSENYEGGTPVMVVKKNGLGNWEASATYRCAVDQGVLSEGEPGEYELNPGELNWLDRQFDYTIKPFFEELEEDEKEVYMHFKIGILMDEDQKDDIVADIERTLKHYCIDAGFFMEWEGGK